MNQPVKRYDTECGYGCSHGSYELKDGPWVKWEDYAAVAEAGRRADILLANIHAENQRLKAENERLRKAGDALAEKFIQTNAPRQFSGVIKYKGQKVVSDWNAAKEGRAK